MCRSCRPDAVKRRLEFLDAKPGDGVFPAPPNGIARFDRFLALQSFKKSDCTLARDAAIESQSGKHVEQRPLGIRYHLAVLDQLEQRIGVLFQTLSNNRPTLVAPDLPDSLVIEALQIARSIGDKVEQARTRSSG
jgi:hypothetical protein